MATFENRSDDALLVTGVVYDIEEVKGAATSTEMNATANVSANVASDAGPMRSGETYELQRPCKEGSQEPLVPPFRIKPHTTGSFEIKVGKDVASGTRWGCSLEVSFQTNEGETNGMVPDFG